MSNKSKTYIYPLIHNYLNLFSIDKLKDTYAYNNIGENVFTLVYEFDEIKHIRSANEFIKLNRVIEESTLLADTVESEDGSKIAYALNIPDELLSTFNLFKRGLYSKFPEKDKYLITRFNQKYYSGFPEEVYAITAILFNNPEYRDKLSKEFGYNIPEGIELSSRPNEDLERFSLEKLNIRTLIF